MALLYVVAAKLPLASALAFQAYLFWPAAALGYTAFLLLGSEAVLGLGLGSLLLNSLGWLPWPQALAMAALQTLGPLVAWRLMLRLGCPHPDLHRTRDLFCWLGVATLASVVFSSGLGTLVVGTALPAGRFGHPVATGFSWFLGDLTAILCLGPALLHFGPRWLGLATPAPVPGPPARLSMKVTVGLLCLLLLYGGRVNPALSTDFRLALQFALVLPILWMAMRFGARETAGGVALLSLAFLAQLWTGGRLPDEVFRFSQLHLLVLALAALVTSVAAEETRLARLALAARDLQAQRMEAVGTLAGGLVHEFNNRLTVVLGNLDRLRPQLPESVEAQDLAQRLEEAALAMGSTVRQLRSLSHQAPLHSFPQPLSEALTPFLLGLGELPRRITFRRSLGPDPVVSLDPDLLNQALQRLLANSVEAIPGQGIIDLRAWQDEASVHLVLEDTGRGMTPEVLQRACDPFFTTKPMATGRGLGLSVAFALTRQLGGQLVLDSRVGQGTRAELVLPLGLVEAAAPTRQAPGILRSHQILLADDESGIRELTRDFLEGEGFLVVVAIDGQEALDVFESDPEVWDLVILDLVMPRLGGEEVLTRIQRLRPSLPALLISGYSTGSRPDLLDSPHRRFLAKPFRLQELLGALHDLGLTSPGKGTLHVK